VKSLLSTVAKAAAQEVWGETKTLATTAVADLREWARTHGQEDETLFPEDALSTATYFRYVYGQGKSGWYPVTQAKSVRPVYIVHGVEFR
jgi:hypothetical protein